MKFTFSGSGLCVIRSPAGRSSHHCNSRQSFQAVVLNNFLHVDGTDLATIVFISVSQKSLVQFQSVLMVYQRNAVLIEGLIT